MVNYVPLWYFHMSAELTWQHPSLQAPIRFLSYVPLINSDQVSLEERQEALRLIAQDLSSLLSLPHHKYRCILFVC